MWQVGPFTLEPLAQEHFTTFRPVQEDVAAAQDVRQRPDIEGRGLAAVKEGRCLAIFFMANDKPGTARVTCFLSDEIKRDHGFFLARSLWRVVKSGFPQYRFLEAQLDPDNRTNRRFAERMGFQVTYMENGSYIFRRASWL